MIFDFTSEFTELLLSCELGFTSTWLDCDSTVDVGPTSRATWLMSF